MAYFHEALSYPLRTSLASREAAVKAPDILRKYTGDKTALTAQAESDRLLSSYDLTYGVNMALSSREAIYFGEDIPTHFRDVHTDMFCDGPLYILPVLLTVDPEQTVRKVLPAILSEMRRLDSHPYTDGDTTVQTVLKGLRGSVSNSAQQSETAVVFSEQWNLAVSVARGVQNARVAIGLQPRVDPVLQEWITERRAKADVMKLSDPEQVQTMMEAVCHANYQTRSFILTTPIDRRHTPEWFMDMFAQQRAWEKLTFASDIRITGEHYAYDPENPRFIAAFRPREFGSFPIRLVLQWDSAEKQVAQLMVHQSQAAYDANESKFRQFLRPAVEQQVRAEVELLAQGKPADFSLERIVIGALMHAPRDGQYTIKSPHNNVGWTRQVIRDMFATYSDILSAYAPHAVTAALFQLRRDVHHEGIFHHGVNDCVVAGEENIVWNVQATGSHSLVEVRAEPTLAER